MKRDQEIKSERPCVVVVVAVAVVIAVAVVVVLAVVAVVVVSSVCGLKPPRHTFYPVNPGCLCCM